MTKRCCYRSTLRINTANEEVKDPLAKGNYEAQVLERSDEFEGDDCVACRPVADEQPPEICNSDGPELCEEPMR